MIFTRRPIKLMKINGQPPYEVLAMEQVTVESFPNKILLFIIRRKVVT